MSNRPSRNLQNMFPGWTRYSTGQYYFPDLQSECLVLSRFGEAYTVFAKTETITETIWTTLRNFTAEPTPDELEDVQLEWSLSR